MWFASQAWFYRRVSVPFQCRTETPASFCKKGLHQKTLWNLKQLNHLYVDLHNERSADLDYDHFLLHLMTDPENSHNALHAQYIIYTLHAP